MRILVVGGGSGGHVTPVVAVCKELLKTQPDSDIRMWCDAKFIKSARASMASIQADIRVEAISAGKLRRYHHLTLLQQLLRVRTIVLPNLVDAVKLKIGFFQSLVKLYQWKPDVVFTKGGFVCLPVGLAAALLKIPLVIHDSDVHPGLTNRILARFAGSIATGAPLKYYDYPKNKSHYVGIPVETSLKPVTIKQQQTAKKSLQLSEHEPVIVITGGGLGAQRLNTIAVKVMPDLLRFASVILVAGDLHATAIKKGLPKAKNLQVHGYVSKDMPTMLKAADIVVTRAGATTLLELAALAKPAVIVPNPHLTGGHQVKNAKMYADAKAAVVLDEAELEQQPTMLVDTINATLLRAGTRNSLSKHINELSRPNAARDMAKLILKASKTKV